MKRVPTPKRRPKDLEGSASAPRPAQNRQPPPTKFTISSLSPGFSRTPSQSALGTTDWFSSMAMRPRRSLSRSISATSLVSSPIGNGSPLSSIEKPWSESLVMDKAAPCNTEEAAFVREPISESVEPGFPTPALPGSGSRGPLDEFSVLCAHPQPIIFYSIPSMTESKNLSFARRLWSKVDNQASLCLRGNRRHRMIITKANWRDQACGRGRKGNGSGSARWGIGAANRRRNRFAGIAGKLSVAH